MTQRPAEKPLLGYCDPWSVAPGDPLRFMVSAPEGGSYRTDIVRLICADDSADGPGFKEEVVESPVNGAHTGRHQPLRAGSYGLVPPSPVLDALTSFTLQAYIWPTLPGAGAQAILSMWSEAEGRGFGLFLDEAGACGLRLGSNGHVAWVSTGVALQARQWYVVTARFDAASGTAQIAQRPLVAYPGIADEGAAAAGVAYDPSAHRGLPFLIAGALADRADGGRNVTAHFNGKIDRPRLARCAMPDDAIEALSHRRVPRRLAEDVVAAWDFAEAMGSTRARDMSATRLDATLHNFPTRAVTGHNWIGDEVDWRRAPEQYGAIHFHEDDMCDAGWEASFSLTIPDGLRSGIYAARLRAGPHEDYVPFFVRPPRGTTTAPLAFLVPTATYMAYANYVSWADRAVIEKLFAAVIVVDETDLFLQEHRELGASTYDTHPDGSGICHGSRHRPLLTIRPKRVPLWNLNADSHITDWLEAKGIAYDVITDEDLHREGVGLLEPYQAVMTATHPEYDSLEMLDAFQRYLDRGGRLLYTGGNGFYWRIAFHPERDGIMEVRRCNGTANWKSEAGEHHHAFDGRFGGIWRERGRPPNALVGVGFASEGFDHSTYYVRKPDSFDPRAAFVFEGVGADEKIGDFGSIGGGASGLEIDRADPAWGTPPHALVLASSEGHSDNYTLVLEDVTLNEPGLGGAQTDLVRADLVFFETPNGGAVFSTGSIAWAGSLAHNDYDNNVSRITENVLRRFLDPEAF